MAQTDSQPLLDNIGEIDDANLFIPEQPVAQLPIEAQFNHTFGSTLEENLQYARVFEAKQKSLKSNYCSVCNQISLRLTTSSCLNCRKHPDQVDVGDPNADINLFCSLNNMDPGIVPPQLSGLRLIEQILIARVKVSMTVFHLRGGQYGYNRKIINFN